jgi:replicative DNA helicase
MLPHSIETEAAVLGGLLTDNAVWSEVDGKLEPEDFYRESHRELFKLIRSHISNGRYIDMLVAVEIVMANEGLYGGSAYVSSLPERCPSTLGVPAYVKKMQELAVRRRILEQCAKLEEMARDKTKDIQELLAEGEKGLQSLAGGMVSDGWVSMQDLCTRQWKEAVKKSEAINEGRRYGWSTGYWGWDKIVGGLLPKNLYILAARPAMGKTALALNVCLNMAAKGNGSAVFSLEMPDGQLGDRLLANAAGIDSYHLRDGIDSRTDDGREAMRRLSGAVEDISRYPIWVDDRPSRIEQIRSRARRLKAKHPELSVIVIDYLQIVSMNSKDAKSREVFINNVAMQSKEMAKELGVAVLDLAQLNRACEFRPIADKGRMPQMSDLRESGGIEQAADAILFIYVDSVYNDACIEPDIADIKIGKNRHGRSGGIFKLRFDKKHQRFIDVDSRY